MPVQVIRGLQKFWLNRSNQAENSEEGNSCVALYPMTWELELSTEIWETIQIHCI